MSKKKDKDEPVIHRRLFDVKTHKIGVVDHGANGRVWVIKSEGLTMKFDATKLTEAAGLLNQVITVTKAGTPDAEAAKVLVEKMQKVDSILKSLGVGGGVDIAGIGDDLAAISEKAKAVASTTQDLTVSDEIDSIQASIKAVQDKLSTTAAPEPPVEGLEEPPKEEPADATPAADAAPAEPAPPAEPPAAEPPAVDPPPAAPPADAAPTDNTPPPAEPPVATDPPPAQEPPGPEAITTDKLESMFNSFKTDVTKMIQSANRPLSAALEVPPASDNIEEIPGDDRTYSGDDWSSIPDDFNEPVS